MTMTTMMMKPWCLILVLLLTLVCCSASVVSPLKNPISLVNPRQKEINVMLTNALSLAVRGGGSLEEEEADQSSVVVTKIRNVIRSLLELGEKKAPSITEFFKGLLKSLESITGVKLLPKVKKSKKSKKKNKSSSVKKKQTKVTSSKKKKTTKEAGKLKQEDDNETSNQQAKKTPVESHKKKKTSVATQKHLSTKISSSNPNYRIQRELKEFLTSPPPNLSVKVGSNIRIWIVTMLGANNTIYEGEVYKLRVSFPKDYPIVPPSVYFLPPTPQHEHVYTNGDICLSLLGKDWRPTMTAQSIAVSILSILSSANSKSLPMDNARHSQNKPGQFQKDWIYHDDNC